MTKVAPQLSKTRNQDIHMKLDGVALIYKSDEFQISGAKNKEKIFGLAVPLKINNIDEEVLFVLTHLKSTKSQEGEELRERQINLLLKELVKNQQGYR